MGVGGGFIMVPAMIYLIGMPTKVVVGTSVFQFLFVTGFTAVLHAVQSGTVDVLLALILLVGGVIGAQLGVGARRAAARRAAPHPPRAPRRRRLPQARRRPRDPARGALLAGRSLLSGAAAPRARGPPRLPAAILRSPCRSPPQEIGRHRRLDRQHLAQRQLRRLGALRLRRGPARRDRRRTGTGPLDIIITVKGPPRTIKVRRKDRRFGIWVNDATLTVRAGAELLCHRDHAAARRRSSATTERLRYGIGMDQAVRRVGGNDSIADTTPFTDALVRLRERHGHLCRSSTAA